MTCANCEAEFTREYTGDDSDSPYCPKCKCRYCPSLAVKDRLCRRCWQDGAVDAFIDARRDR